MNKKITPFLRLACSIILLQAVTAGLAYGQLRGDTYATAKSSGKANVIFSYVETPGFAGKDAAGNPDGFCVDMMNAFVSWLKKNEGIDMQPTFSGKDAKDFKKFMAGVQAGKGGVFGLGNITITEERMKTYSFSPPFITNVAILITHKSVPTLEHKEKIASAFGGMQAVVVTGTTNEVRMNNLKKSLYPALTYQHVSSSPEALKRVMDNPKLFTNLDFTYYLMALKDGMPIKRHPAGDESTESFGIVMPKNSDWSPVMARFMKEFVGSTEYRKLINDHLGANALKLLDAVAAN